LPGIYAGYTHFKTNFIKNKEIILEKSYKSVLSIGFNPYFDNSQMTIENFLIDYEGEDFYGEEIKVALKFFLRTEANFENFNELVTAITYDIIIADRKLND